MLDFLMDQFVGAVLYYDTNHPPGTIDERLVSFISDNYRNAYRLQTEGKNEAEKLYLRLLLVTDFVCGMTDGYAKRLYQEMKRCCKCESFGDGSFESGLFESGSFESRSFQKQSGDAASGKTARHQ